MSKSLDPDQDGHYVVLFVYCEISHAFCGLLFCFQNQLKKYYRNTIRALNSLSRLICVQRVCKS